MQNGGTLVGAVDGDRILSQRDRVLSLMSDGSWRTLYEIEDALGYPSASVSARLRDFRKPQYGAHIVERRRREESGGTFEYRVLPPTPTTWVQEELF